MTVHVSIESERHTAVRLVEYTGKCWQVASKGLFKLPPELDRDSSCHESESKQHGIYFAYVRVIDRLEVSAAEVRFSQIPEQNLRTPN
jgi:hypothetical protein